MPRAASRAGKSVPAESLARHQHTVPTAAQHRHRRGRDLGWNVTSLSGPPALGQLASGGGGDGE